MRLYTNSICSVVFYGGFAYTFGKPYRSSVKLDRKNTNPNLPGPYVLPY